MYQDISLGIRLIYKLAKFLTQNSNKVHKPKTYDKLIDNLIYENRWHKAIDKKL